MQQYLSIYTKICQIPRLEWICYGTSMQQPYIRTFPRKKNIFDPNSREVYRISRSKIEDFLRCPRCFYLDRRLGIGKPDMPPFTINSAIDELLKKEFDIHRKQQTKHPLIEQYKIPATPFKHESMDAWRDALTGGITHTHEPTNLFITGGIDDIWIDDETGELHIVDYKATAKTGGPIEALDSFWHESYKRQVEIYQWLFRQNGFSVSNTAYFVYCNVKTAANEFNNTLEFDTTIIPHHGNSEWVEPVIRELHACLIRPELPDPAVDCQFCKYRWASQRVE